jgi:tRNA pseudouridine55 synthase
MEDLDFESGAMLMIDKPQTWTSFDVVKKLRYTLKVKKIGHAGTLDPLATGLLIVCTGKFTKKINEYQGMGKVYEGIIEVGKTTPSYDLETEFDSESAYDHLTPDELYKAAQSLTGQISQIPPVFSAVKVGGKRAYKSARNNEEVKLDPRLVEVSEFELTKIDLPEVHFRIKCSKGTYIRSMAHDFGHALGCGAYLKYLRRTAIGEYNVEDAYSLDGLIEKAQAFRLSKENEDTE